EIDSVERDAGPACSLLDSTRKALAERKVGATHRLWRAAVGKQVEDERAVGGRPGHRGKRALVQGDRVRRCAGDLGQRHIDPVGGSPADHARYKHMSLLAVSA